MFTLKFTTTGAAFDELDAEDEIVRILKDVGGRVAALDGTREGAIRDINGNLVGAWSWTD